MTTRSVRVSRTYLSSLSHSLLLCAALGACSRGDVPRADTARADSAAQSPAGNSASSQPAAPAPSPDQAPSSNAVLEWKVRPDGVRGAIIGRTSSVIRQALGVGSGAAFPKGSCEYLNAPDIPVKLMFVSDTLVRIDVRESRVTTMEGAAIGDTEARINELYAGRVTTTPHKYTGPTGHYLTVAQPTFPQHLLVFETDGQRVTTYRLGRKPEVEWVEGCA